MSGHIAPILSLIVILNLTACKMSYKQGADDQELHADQQQCEDETDTSKGPVFIECMQRSGWMYNDMSEPAGDSANVRSMAAGNAEAPETVQQNQTTPVSTTGTETHHPEELRGMESPEAQDKADQPQRIGGWYRLASDAEPLQGAKSECDETGSDKATFIACMKDKGWRPISIRFSWQEPSDVD